MFTRPGIIHGQMASATAGLFVALCGPAPCAGGFPERWAGMMARRQDGNKPRLRHDFAAESLRPPGNKISYNIIKYRLNLINMYTSYIYIHIIYY